jgi:hypothetical protein
MKNRQKALELIECGLSAKLVKKLTESQISQLHKRMVSEQVIKTERYLEVPTSKLPTGVNIPTDIMAGKKQVTVQSDPSKGVTKIIPTEEGEMKEDETDDVTSSNAQGDLDLQKYTGQEAPHDANDMAPDGMDDDSDDDRKMMGMAESKKKNNKTNPWAICTAQLGKEFGTRERHLWSAKEKNKYERCVKDVKKSLTEGKKPLSLFIENEILKLVEKHLPPKITKGELMKYLSEDGPAVAPSKPKPSTKPDTKPGKPAPRPRPKHPGQNPHPGEKESPRAEEVKNKVIKTIFKDIFKK